MASKRDYERAAQEIKALMNQGQNRSADYYEGVIETAQVLAIAFKNDNPNFDRERFLVAAGVTF